MSNNLSSAALPQRVGVIIPFFQRQPGLLLTALASIGAQSVLADGCCSIQVAIVDDSSPLPAATELDGYLAPPGMEVIVKLQDNGGAGAARNTALAMLDERCEVVAFLDSDDAWVPEHLARALAALTAGANFYFCDAVRGENEPSENAAAPSWFTCALRPINSENDLFLYDGPTDLAVVKGLVPTTSTIVHRRQRGSNACFPSRYFRFGEDQYYCLSYLATEGKIAYSSVVEVQCGRGVNIFAGNVPGSESARLCLVDEIAYRRDALATLALSAPAEQHVKVKLAAAQLAILQQGLWFATDGRTDWLIRSLCAQPRLFLHLPRAIRSLLRIRRGADQNTKSQPRQAGE